MIGDNVKNDVVKVDDILDKLIDDARGIVKNMKDVKDDGKDKNKKV